MKPTREQLLSIATFGSNREQSKVYEIVNVEMCLRGYPPMLVSLYIVPTTCDPLVSQPIATSIDKINSFKGLDFADYSNGKSSLQVDVLIGSDYYWELVTGSVCRSERGPTAIHTKLGWVLSGPTQATSPLQCSANLVTTHVLRVDAQQDETVGLDEQLRSFWELESLGVQEKEKTLFDAFTTHVTFRDGRYHVYLPWKEFHEPLPDNYSLSAKRLQKAFDFYAQTKELFRRGGFNLQKFLTNSKELQLKINQAEGVACEAISSDPLTETYAQTALGSQSSTESDKCKILVYSAASDKIPKS